MSREVRAGGAFIELGVRSAIDKGLAKAQKKLNAWGRRMSATGATLAAGSAGLLAAPVMAAAESQEALSKFNTVFGESSAAMLKWSNTAAGALGVAESDFQSMLSGLQDLLVPMGMLPDAATNVSKSLASLAVDLGSFNNRATADVMNDLMAAMTGSSETVKRYGIILNQAALNQELLSMGMDPKNATEAAKAQARFNIIMRMTTQAQGDAIRTAGSFANQMKRLRSNVGNFLGDVGAPLLDTLSGIAQTMNGTLKATRSWMAENQGLVKVAVMSVAGIGALGGALAITGGAIALASVAVGGLATGIGLLLSPIGAAGLAIAGLAGYFFSSFRSMGEITQWFHERFGGLAKGVSDSMTVITHAIGQGDFAGAWDVALAAMEMLWLDLTSELSEAWTGTMGSLVDGAVWATTQIGKLFTVMGSAIVKTLDFISRQQNWVKNRTTEAISKITGERIVGGDVFTGSALPPSAENAIRAAASGISSFGEQVQAGAQQLGDETKKSLDIRAREREARLAALRDAAAGQAEVIQAAKDAVKSPEGPGAFNMPKVLAAQAAGATMAGGASSRGTFSSFGAFALGTRAASTQEEIAKNTKATAQGVERIVKKAGPGVARLG